MAFVVIYDACVLYPAPLRDLLVRIAQTLRGAACLHREVAPVDVMDTAEQLRQRCVVEQNRHDAFTEPLSMLPLRMTSLNPVVLR